MNRATLCICFLLLLGLGTGLGCNKDRKQVQELAKEVQESEAKTNLDDSFTDVSTSSGDSLKPESSESSEVVGAGVDDSTLNDSAGTAVASLPATEAPPEQSSGSRTSMPPRLVDGYTIQIGSSIDRSYSEKIARQFSDRGYQAYVSEVEMEGVAHFRVRIGDFQTVAEARKQGDELQTKYGVNYWVDRNLK